MLSRFSYQFSRPSQPTEMCDRMKAPRGISGWMAPQVPMRRMSSVRCSGLTSRVLKSMLARASSSVITMSMLSVPMPVDRTVMRLPLYRPVAHTNSREAASASMEEK